MLSLKSEQLPCYPSGAVPINSHFYLKREPFETQIYEEIKKPGALVRIKAPREMGKTSLLLRILEYANCQNYHSVSLNLDQIDEVILNDLNRFLRWLCANVTRQLQIEPRLDDYWDEDMGSKISCCNTVSTTELIPKTLYANCYCNHSRYKSQFSNS